MHDLDLREAATDAAREVLYRFLAMAFRPPTETFALLKEEPVRSAACAAADLLRRDAVEDPVPLGFGERGADYLDLTAASLWWEAPPDELFAEYDRVFGFGAGDCPPYETEFFPNSEPFARAQQMADVAGFYRAFGLAVARDRPDSLCLELEFMALLLSKQRLAASGENVEQVELCRDAQRDFLRDHLAWWLPSYCTGLASKAGSGPYAALAKALAAFLPTERNRFGIKSPAAPVRPKSIPAEESMGCGGCVKE